MMDSSPVGSADATQSDLARQVERLTDELEAAQIERDQYKATTEIMAQALEQMSELLSPQKPRTERRD